MSALAPPRPPPPAPEESSAPAPQSSSQPLGIGVAPLGMLLFLLLAAALPLNLLFVGWGWVRPIGGAMLIAVGIAWGMRQTGAPALVTSAVNVLAWAAFICVVFAPTTLALGIVPTAETAAALRALSVRAAEQFMLQAAPVGPDPAFLLTGVTGVWLVSLAAAYALLQRGSGLHATAIALVMFTFPLPLAPRGSTTTVQTVVFLAAAASCLLLAARGDLRRWEQLRPPRPPGDRPQPRSLPSGWGLSALAIVAGLALADALPGAGEPPWYELRGRGGTTVTTNPMVSLRPNLTGQDSGPVMFVTSSRPVYLRTTALDVYDEHHERWTVDRIRGAEVGRTGRLAPEVATAALASELTVDVEVAGLRGILVPVPYPPLSVAGPAARSFQYDGANGTVTVAGGAVLETGDTYTVTAALPPGAEALARVEGFAPDSHLTAVPEGVPDTVALLAREIVEGAGATTPFQQALAIQEELRTWTYSLEPEQGHDGDALEAFLDARVGYCEQFAASMALMLRTLDIPARVAVGFSPGQLVDQDEGRWRVSNANAHAWVEVLFPGHGWMAFEPTPRSDGNVLVPTAANLAPTDTEAGDRASGGQIPDFDDEDLFPDLDLDAAEGALPPPGGDDGSTGGGAGDRGRTGIWVIAAATAVAGSALAAVLLARARGTGAAPPGSRSRIARARRRAERLGQGLGLPLRPSSTDAEFLARLGARVGRPEAAGALAAASARARYALDVGPADVDAAERAAAAIAHGVPNPFTRALLRTKGTGVRALRALRLWS